MKLTLLLLLFVTQINFGQQRTCGTAAYMETIMSNPEAKAKHLLRQQKFEIELAKVIAKQSQRNNSSTSSPTAIIRIPVAVHYPSVPGITSVIVKNCLKNLAQSQINIINADYNAANADISNWASASAFYPGVNVGNFEVQFEIATQNHPAGTNIANGATAITFGTDFLNDADSDTTWSGYMNFVVRDLGNNILGYSPLAGSPADGQTVVMNTFCFGSGGGCNGYAPAAPFNLGRTVTHELGHFFNLDHTFGNGNGCAGNTDFVADTPQVGVETYNCPANGAVNGCVAGQKSMTMNYMDYVDDACMFMFTAGQKQRSLAYINTIVSEFNTNVLSTNSFAKTSFSIFPNPNKGNFTIEFSDLIGSFKVEVFDITGRKIYTASTIETTDTFQNIQLENTSKGIYLVSVTTENDTITKKIILE